MNVSKLDCGNESKADSRLRSGFWIPLHVVLGDYKATFGSRARTICCCHRTAGGKGQGRSYGGLKLGKVRAAPLTDAALFGAARLTIAGIFKSGDHLTVCLI